MNILFLILFGSVWFICGSIVATLCYIHIKHTDGEKMADYLMTVYIFYGMVWPLTVTIVILYLLLRNPIVKFFNWLEKTYIKFYNWLEEKYRSIK